MEECSTLIIADVLGKKWTLPLLQQIDLHGQESFNGLMRRMKKVSPKIMTQRLKALEEQGVVSKIITSEPTTMRTQYTLTPKGKDLQELLQQFKLWNEKYTPAVQGCSQRECVQCARY